VALFTHCVEDHVAIDKINNGLSEGRNM
jgi:hypothetical protein